GEKSSNFGGEGGTRGNASPPNRIWLSPEQGGKRGIPGGRGVGEPQFQSIIGTDNPRAAQQSPLPLRTHRLQRPRPAQPHPFRHLRKPQPPYQHIFTPARAPPSPFQAGIRKMVAPRFAPCMFELCPHSPVCWGCVPHRLSPTGGGTPNSDPFHPTA